MLKSTLITAMHDRAVDAWHRDAGDTFRSLVLTDQKQQDLLELASAQHRANYELWHQEDQARDPEASSEVIASVKHEIDRLNQRRNDLVEQMDLLLLATAGPQNPDLPLHSETPGLIIDRLSILALKLYHTAEESHRHNATEEHRTRTLARWELIGQQREDLAHCLDDLWNEVTAGTRRFKLYRQLKMYNDPDLNPVLYRSTVQQIQKEPAETGD